MGLGAVRGDGRAVVAEVDVRLEAGDALAGDARALEAADQLFALARKHRAGDDFEDAGGGGHWSFGNGNGVGGGFLGVIFFWRGGVAFLLGVLREMGCRTWFFAGEIVVDCVVNRGWLAHVFWVAKICHFFRIYFWVGVDNAMLSE